MGNTATRNIQMNPIHALYKRWTAIWLHDVFGVAPGAITELDDYTLFFEESTVCVLNNIVRFAMMPMHAVPWSHCLERVVSGNGVAAYKLKEEMSVSGGAFVYDENEPVCTRHRIVFVTRGSIKANMQGCYRPRGRHRQAVQMSDG